MAVPRRAALRALLLISLCTSAVDAQESEPKNTARVWNRALANHFAVGLHEVEALSRSGSSPDELPVVLFLARRSGATADAVLALRRSGTAWSDIGKRFGLTAAAFHLPLEHPFSDGALGAAYRRFDRTPVTEWDAIRLSDREILALVNVRVISSTLRVPPQDVLAEGRAGESYSELFARVLRDRSGGA